MTPGLNNNVLDTIEKHIMHLYIYIYIYIHIIYGKELLQNVCQKSLKEISGCLALHNIEICTLNIAQQLQTLSKAKTFYIIYLKTYKCFLEHNE